MIASKDTMRAEMDPEKFHPEPGRRCAHKLVVAQDTSGSDPLVVLAPPRQEYFAFVVKHDHVYFDDWPG